MKFFILILFLGVAWASSKQEINEEVQPEQVHLSFGDATNEIVVTWSTLAEAKSVVLYGIHETNKRATGSSSVFVDGGKERRKQWIHRVKLKNLAHNTKYVYKAGSDAGYSQQFSFRTPPAGENWPMRIAIYGDMGVNNSMALPYLKRDVEAGMYDFILHVGDFAYDMNEQGGRVGDQFMNKIEPLAANLPYMTCPGNHESAYNFTHYSHRFTMPGDRSSLFYSFDVGPVHFVSISTEVYYFTQYGLKLISDQYHWLKKDLEKAAKIENRQKRPWIVVFGHRPMYCSNSDDYDCSVEYTRVGLYGFFGLEPLLKDYGVDIALWAHEHSYERTWPLYDQRMYNGTTHPYTNPGAPVHIITGSAGCREGKDPFKKTPAEWSAFRSKDYGYTKFYSPNKTHIYFEQVSVDLDGQVIDSFWLVKTKMRFTLAPVHIVTGSAGCREGRDRFKHDPPKWSAFRSQDYGYTKFFTPNKTHIYIEQVSADLDGQVIDSFWLIKTKLRFNL